MSRTFELLSPLSHLKYSTISSCDFSRAAIHAEGCDRKRSQFLQNAADVDVDLSAMKMGETPRNL